MRNNNCILNLIKVIDLLQKNSMDYCSLEHECSRPYLGPNGNFSCYNTRPISLYTKEGELFTFFNTSFFRVEEVHNSCVTLQALIKSNDSYVATNEFITINTNCFCVIRCFNDTSITCI